MDWAWYGVASKLSNEVSGAWYDSRMVLAMRYWSPRLAAAHPALGFVYSLAAAGLFALPSAAAEEGDRLAPVTVTAPRLERDALDTPAAVSVVGEERFQRGRSRRKLSEGLDGVPGLFFQNRYNFAQGLRISSRGFGARAPFGVRGLQVRLDGLPLTLPDGQTQLDTIDLDSVERAEVLRGPSSVLYGNASGGVIDITTRDGRDMRYSPVVRVDKGSDEFNRVNARIGGANGDWSHHVSLTGLDFGGHRDQSRVKRGRLHAKVRRDLGEGRSLTGIATLLDAPTGEDPSGLTPEEADDDPEQATRFSRLLDAGQDVDQQRVGLVYEDGSGDGELTARAHYTRRDFSQQLPFPGSSLIGFERDFFGAGFSYQGQLGPGDDAVSYLVGASWDRQIDDRERFNVGPAGTVQGLDEKEEQRATALGAFAQVDVPIAQRWTVTLGVRGDRNRFEINDKVVGPADPDESGERDFEEASYLAGVSFRPVPDHQLYANLSTAFQTPTFTEFANPEGGGFNPDVEPQDALNREIGARGRLGDDLDYELALFSVRVEDELIPFEPENTGVAGDARDFFENAGRTRRNGLELGLEWFAADAWTVRGSYTYADYEFRSFTEDGESRRGNQLPGIPRHDLQAELLWEPTLSSYAAISGQVVDSVYADNANSEEIAGYALAHLRAGHAWFPGTPERLEVYGAIRNLFDRDYPANVRINTDSFIEPGPGRTVFVGVEAAF